MLTAALQRKLEKCYKDPLKRAFTNCPYCHKSVESASPDSEYIKTKHSEHFFHRSCLAKAIREQTGGML